MKDSAVTFTVATNEYHRRGIVQKLINSFTRFHPDIPLIVFGQDVYDRFGHGHLFKYRAIMANTLKDKFDLVVNIDADTVITGRLERVFDDGYDVGAAWDFHNVLRYSFEDIKEDMRLHSGLVASRNKRFWDIWNEANHAYGIHYRFQDMDTLAKLWYHHPEVMAMRLRIWDRERDYYNCKSLGLEPEFYVKHDMLWCRGERVMAYHNAMGVTAPKLEFDHMPFTPEVREWLKKVSSPL